MDSLVGVTLNGVVVLLLCAAIVYGIVLHRKLTALQSAQSELAALLCRLDGAITQASTTVSAFKSNAALVEMPRPPMPVERPAPAARPAAPVELPKSLAGAARPPASVAGSGRFEAARELLEVMNARRSAG